MQQIRRALESIKAHPELDLVKTSCWYQSKAVGPGEQPDYINGAALVTSNCTPEALLDILQTIEHNQGRVRAERWGPRPIDLDILIFDQLTISDKRLTIPHKQLTQRNFVILPMLDIDANVTLPDGRKVADFLHIIGNDDIEKLSNISAGA